jgi:hypothetical protein
MSTGNAQAGLPTDAVKPVPASITHAMPGWLGGTERVV